MKELLYDIEVYPNKNCVTVLYDNKVAILDTPKKIKTLPIHNNNYLFIGFNNRRYDHPILEQMQQGLGVYDIYKMSKSIIHEGLNAISWATNIVDLYEICPKISKCSLKEFGHRLGYPILQNLPYPYDKELTDDEWEIVKTYSSVHDLGITKMLWAKLKEEYHARQSLKLFFDINTEFGGAPKVGEKAILSQLGDNKIAYSSSLVKQSNLKLSPILEPLYNQAFSYSLDDYVNEPPEFMKEKIDINGCLMSIRSGGLHGNTYTGVYHDVYEYDVTSYYPSIILNCKLGSTLFRIIYERIYDHRLRLKEEGSKGADALKLVLNSLYGKLNDKYADDKIYAPHLALTICLLGQFYLLDLIEKLDFEQCLIANTDGIMCTHEIPSHIWREWQQRTGFKLTVKKYKTMIVKDVNSYYAIDDQGDEKRKKEFLTSRWTHNVKAPIIQQAVIDNIIADKDIEKTIRTHTKLYDFCFFTKAKRGNVLLLDDKPLPDPKVRYYISKKGYVLKRKSEKMESRIVSDSNISLAMDLSDDKNKERLNNINFEWYITEAIKLKERIFKNVKRINNDC